MRARVEVHPPRDWCAQAGGKRRIKPADAARAGGAALPLDQGVRISPEGRDEADAGHHHRTLPDHVGPDARRAVVTSVAQHLRR